MPNNMPTDMDKKSYIKYLQQDSARVLGESDSSLWQQRQVLKQALKGQIAEQKKLSKSIGPAKKAGDDISELMSSMRALSGEIKAQQNHLAELEQGLYQAYLDALAAEQAEIEQDSEYSLKQLPLADIRISQEFDEICWNEFVDRHPGATFYHQYSLLALLEHQFGHKAYRFVAYYNDEIVGVLPMLRQTSRLFGDFCSSIPFFNYGGALESAAGVREALMQYARQVLLREGVSYCEFRDSEPMPDWPLKTDKVIMQLALPATIAELDQAIGTKLRAQIKRPQRENPEVRIGGLELLDDFYCVFTENMRDLGTPVYQRSFFAELLRNYSSAVLVVVYLRGKPVSTGFLLGYRDTLEIPWASTLRSANKYSMNMLLYWSVLSYAIEQGYKVFDFGRSSKDAGTYKFKAQWGAKELPCYWHYGLAEGEELPQLNPNNPKYKLMISIWQRLPVWLVNIIGPFIVKNLP